MRNYPFITLVALVLVAGCKNEPPDKPVDAESGTADATNRVDIPATVRDNIGITFAKVEARHVDRTIRSPGRFELAPEARREYRTMLGGRVELHVSQYEFVEPAKLLFTLDSPHWRELQERLNETESKLAEAKGRSATIEPLMAAHRRHHDELETGVAIWTERVEQLERSNESGVITAEEFAQSKAVLASTRADLAEVLEKEAELQARKVEIKAQLNGARERLELLLMNASTILGIPVANLVAIDPASPQEHPRWREINVVEVRAAAKGVVESVPVTNGAWASETSLVMTTVQPDKLRFRAMGLQTDLPRFNQNSVARIAPPESPRVDIGDSVNASLTIGLEAHPDERTISLVATPQEKRPWMRPGVSAFLEVVAESSGGKALAIPRSAIVKDGITHVFFRRDPNDANKAIRVEADMGVDDGRWVVINSGLALGDEVVLEGAYELKLATAQSGTSQKGGHFHADGAFHDKH
ncbi:MAG: hypothetical protein R3E58_01915 [Phycisphaerae bacterium]|nr:hypothetical protein [Phycisphaerales bacterium]